MKRKVKDIVRLEDGLHEGEIIKLLEREKPYPYVDLVIEFELKDHVGNMTVGFPDFVSSQSKLGQLLIRFGQTLTVDEEIELNDLIGKKCQFVTVTKKSKKDDREYSNIVPDSVKPI